MLGLNFVRWPEIRLEVNANVAFCLLRVVNRQPFPKTFPVRAEGTEMVMDYHL